MPHFCETCGGDTYICQKCAKVFCNKEHPSTWRPDITGHSGAGNVCPACLGFYGLKPKPKPDIVSLAPSKPKPKRMMRIEMKGE